MKKSILLLAAAVAMAGCSTTSPEKSHNEAAQEGVAKSNQFWWPKLVNLSPLRQNASESNPLGEEFDYAEEFRKLNLMAIKKDLSQLMRKSQDWWPADYGHYGPFFIRMAWHSAGTYRTFDGRGGAGGGQQRFEPLNSWPDNVNLDKARRLLWPIKKKYGNKISWADLMVLAGTVAMEDMGFKTFGFAGGRTDDWEPELVYWGPETKLMARNRHGKDGSLKKGMGATQMGLIYVNPEGPDGKPDFALAGKAIREAFGRMAMNDEETVALIAGGHSFGKSHGAHKPSKCVQEAPSAAPTEAQGLGWKNKCGKGHSEDTVGSGLEGAWTATPTEWSIQFLSFLYGFEWESHHGPGGALQWKPVGDSADDLVPDAHVKGKKHAPMMFTTDLALRFDPIYGKISKRFLENPDQFEDAFARAWFKLTHRDMGPRARYLGGEVPSEVLSWQDPTPKGEKISNATAESIKRAILKTKLSVPELVSTAWASAASYRGTDMRGGANGARVRLAPQKDWAVNNPGMLSDVLAQLTKIKEQYRNVSLADVIVLGGHAAVEKAAKDAGISVKVDLKSGRGDASQENTDIKSFAALEPKADGFRNFYSKDSQYSPVVSLIDRANMLTLTVPEMTVLVGGLRVLGANSGGSSNGVFTKKVGVLTPDFFVNLYDMSTKWVKSENETLYEGRDRSTGKMKWTATPVDLVFGSSAELRAVGEVYASDDGKEKFVRDFVKAWTKVMRLDRFDLI